MPILKDHKLAFIHIPKTGGVSIINTFGFEVDYHYPASYYHADYMKLTIIRHPVERFESAVAYIKNIESCYHKHIPKEHHDFKNKTIDQIADDIQTLTHLVFKPQFYFINEPGVAIFKTINECYYWLCERLKKNPALLYENKTPCKEKLVNLTPVLYFYKQDIELWQQPV